ncbi:serine/arginine repetitive matrix protein 1-like [Dermacentor silvarum]|uniref:serine/arginine repetitive matrix protein 1-like n=1 Tax=Dermacentor silvarum TaxID=543639 RepID=UPI002101C19E|nr:serine/arginine repetitive matrix protein 1-like [Dermacentor silvarum]
MRASTEIHSADAQPSTAPGAHRSAGKTKLSIFDRFLKRNDGPPTSGRPAIASAPRPTSPKWDFATSRLSARRSAPLELNADSIRIPRDRCEVPMPATAYNIGSRSRSTAAEKSSESEAEAIAVRHSKWVTFGTPSPRASQEIERGRQDHCRESSGVLESTRSRCIETTNGIDHGSNRGRAHGSDLQHLSNTHHADLSDLIEDTCAQLKGARKAERRWSAPKFGDDQPRPETLEEKVAAWDPNQETYALSPPGELELFELETIDPRRTRRPKPAPRNAALCCESKPSCARSPTSPPKIKRILPVTAADSSMYEDLHWFIESCEQSATSTPLCDRATTAGTSTPKAEARPASLSIKAGAATRQADTSLAPVEKGKASSVAPGVSYSLSGPREELPQERARGHSMADTSIATPVVPQNSCIPPKPATSTSRRDVVSPYAPKPSSSGKSDGLADLNWMPVVESHQVAGPVAPGTEEDKTKGGDARSNEPDEQEAAARGEKKHHRKHDRKKHHRKKKLAKLKKKERAKAARLTQDEAALPTSEQQGPSAASPRCQSDHGSNHRGAAAAATAAAAAASPSVDPEPDGVGDEVTHIDSGTVSISIRTLIRTRSGLLWPFNSPHDS